MTIISKERKTIASRPRRPSVPVKRLPIFLSFLFEIRKRLPRIWSKWSALKQNRALQSTSFERHVKQSVVWNREVQQPDPSQLNHMIRFVHPFHHPYPLLPFLFFFLFPAAAVVFVKDRAVFPSSSVRQSTMQMRWKKICFFHLISVESVLVGHGMATWPAHELGSNGRRHFVRFWGFWLEKEIGRFGLSYWPKSKTNPAIEKNT